MKRVFLAADPDVIELVRSWLAPAGIATTTLNEDAATARGGFSFLHAAAELWVVRDEDEPAARAIIAKQLSSLPRGASQRAPWQCPQCGQAIDGQFTTCWYCRLTDDDDPRKDPDAKCDECGYRLWGLPLRRCPECGTEF